MKNASILPQATSAPRSHRPMFTHPAARLGTLCLALAACNASDFPDLTAPDVTAAVLNPFWVTKQPLPAPYLFAKAGAVNNVIYMVGGQNSGKNPVDTVRAYTIATNTWALQNPLPSARYDVNGVSAIGKKLYVSGGAAEFVGATKTLYVYNTVTDQWTRKADMPVAGACGNQGVIGGKLYVYTRVGSCSGGHAFLRYDPDTDTWIYRATPPNNHQSAVSGVIAGKLYIAGGGGDVTFSPNYSLHVYTPATNSWATRAPLPGKHQAAAGGALAGKLYVAGAAEYGVPGFPPYGTVRVYDPATDSWANVFSMKTPRHSAAGVNAGGAIWVISGLAKTGRSTKVEMYKPFAP